MTIYSQENRTFIYRRALEALRNGVPNKDAVRLLGCNQSGAESRFGDMLANAPGADGALGLLVSGEFGAGKSHLLTHLEDQALTKKFICSRVTISKETPLYNLAKVFKSAVDNGRMLNLDGQLINGRLIQELISILKPDEHDELLHWADSESSRLSPVFPASLMIHRRARDSELNSEIEAFWAGDMIPVSKIKGGLKRIRQLQRFSFRAPRAAELPPQRLRFVTELIKSAGYMGWVILLDEIELIGSYSILQRGRSYAELSRWLGQAHGETNQGLVVVGAVTTDFADNVLRAREDLDKAGQRLRARGDEALATLAETGMRLLETGCIVLNRPSAEDVNATIAEIRKMYSEAYRWDAPLLNATSGVGDRARMRYQVRAAINEWDLQRLYPDSQPETVSEEFDHSYEEDPDLSRESQEDDTTDT